MSIRANTLTVLACAALVTGSLLACKKKKAPAPTPSAVAATAPKPTATAPKVTHKVYKVGDTGSALDFKLTVSNVKQCKNKYYFSKPKKGNIWIGVEMLVESASDKPFFANPGRAKITDGEGIAYNPTYRSTKGCSPTLKGTQLAKGEKAKGWVVFEIPKDASGLKLSYNPSLFGASQTIKFDLGR